MRMPTLKELDVQFRPARSSPEFAELYLRKVLLPGIEHPAERAGLFASDLATLCNGYAVIGIASTGQHVVGGLHLVLDGWGTLWFQGVRVSTRFQGQGYGYRLMRAGLAFGGRESLAKRFSLNVRCSTDGVPFPAAFKLYSSCGFRPVGLPKVVRVSGKSLDKHLGETGTCVLAQRLDWHG